MSKNVAMSMFRYKKCSLISLALLEELNVVTVGLLLSTSDLFSKKLEKQLSTLAWRLLLGSISL